MGHALLIGDANHAKDADAADVADRVPALGLSPLPNCQTACEPARGGGGARRETMSSKVSHGWGLQGLQLAERHCRRKACNL